MKNQKKYNAFTLLELLISIIILGIVMSSFPFIIQSMTSSSKQIMKEEVFFHEFSLLSLINSRYFDEKNTIGDNFYKDLNATLGGSQGDSELLNTRGSMYAGKHSRVGKAQFNNNILRSGSSDTLSVIGLDTMTGEIAGDVSTYDDIDDFNGYTESFADYDINVSVSYINDNANYYETNMSGFSFDYSNPVNVSNIKLITIRCMVDGTNIVLRYPTSNIGASKYLSLEEISR